MARTLDTLPGYLKKYCIEHDVSKYTARDHASWRYIMRRAVPFFSQNAVQGYEEGLAATGISVDRIPHIDEMDSALQKIGWGAVPVCGFIPPWAFLEFQARKILPIATDMRSVDHIAYTPAPDIVHEAAGHAPILPDVDYNNYLAYYAKLGTKAVYSNQDLQLYESIRYLSDIKEKPESTPEEIADAERRLSASVRAFSYVSEATKVGRMSWWTAEYGLAGNSEQPKIYGAGLLSSVGESHNAMTQAVKKIPLSIDCTNFSFNITEPQPQLFIAEDMKHLHDVLHELDETLAYRTGGIYGLTVALACNAVTTTVLSSGLQISGRLTKFENKKKQIDFIKFDGPVQLCFQDKELPGQGISRHSHGYSSPLGRFKLYPETPTHRLTQDQLTNLGLNIGSRCELEFHNGFILNGELSYLHQEDGINLYMTFKNCQVRRGDQVYFEPEWGEFDLGLGDEVTSVFGGPCQRETYGEQEIIETTTTPGRSVPYTDSEIFLFDQYQDVRELRTLENKTLVQEKAQQIAKSALNHTPEEWLLLLELYELSRDQLKLDPKRHDFVGELETHLQKGQNSKGPNAEQIKHGLELIH